MKSKENKITGIFYLPNIDPMNEVKDLGLACFLVDSFEFNLEHIFYLRPEQLN